MMKAKLFMALLAMMAMMAMMTACSDEDNNGGKEEPAKKRLVEVNYSNCLKNNSSLKYDERGRLIQVIINDSVQVQEGNEIIEEDSYTAIVPILKNYPRTRKIDYSYISESKITIDEAYIFPDRTNIQHDTLFLKNGLVEEIHSPIPQRYFDVIGEYWTYSFKYSSDNYLQEILFVKCSGPSYTEQNRKQICKIHWNNGNIESTDNDQHIFRPYCRFKYSEEKEQNPFFNVFTLLTTRIEYGLLADSGIFGKSAGRRLSRCTIDPDEDPDLWYVVDYTDKDNFISHCTVKKPYVSKRYPDLQYVTMEDMDFVWK